MNNLHNLEEIANQLGNMYKPSYSVHRKPIKVNEKSAEQIKSELDDLENNSVETKKYIEEKIIQLEKLAENLFNSGVSNSIDSATSIISDINTARNSINLAKDDLKVLHKNYRQKLLSGAGFNNYDDLLNQIRELDVEKSNLTGKFLGKFIFKNNIDKLNSELKSLNKLSYIYSQRIYLADMTYFTNEHFNFLQTKLFKTLADYLVINYAELAKQIKPSDSNLENINPIILDSLVDEYVQKYFESKIIKKLENAKKRDDDYGREQAAIFSNKPLVKETLSILKQGLNQKYDLNSETYKKEAELLNERLKALPYALQNIIEYKLFRDNKTPIDSFIEFSKYLIQFPLDIQRKELSHSLSIVEKHLLNTSVNPNLPPGVTYAVHDFERVNDQIKRSLEPLIKFDFFQDIDMRNWVVFKDNSQNKQIYGVERLESFNQLLKENIFDNLLSSPSRTDDSVRLGYAATNFNDTESIAYNILNFWREHGHSGDRPFLSLHSNTEETICAEYVNSLTDTQMLDIEQSKIPGLFDIITKIKENLYTFRDHVVNEGDKSIANPVYEKIEEGLGKICAHYFESGSEKEVYFSSCVVKDLSFMIFADKPSEQRAKLIEALSNRLGLDNYVQDNLKKQYLDVTKCLGNHARKLTSLEEYKQDLLALSKYHNDFSNLLISFNDSDEIKKEADSIKNHLTWFRELNEDLPNLISYLIVFATKLVQDNLANSEFSEYYKQRLSYIKGKIFFDKRLVIKDVIKYTTNEFTVFSEFVDSTNNLIEKSLVNNVLKLEQARLLTKLASTDDFSIDTKYMYEYFKALDDNKVAKIFAKKDVRAKTAMVSLAKTIYDYDNSLVVPMIKESVLKDISYQQQSYIQNYIPKIASFSNFINMCKTQTSNQKSLFNLIYELSLMGEDSIKIVSEINEGILNFSSVQESINILNKTNLRSTSYLVKQLLSVENKKNLVKDWLKEIDSFSEGNFDSTNELHKNLEYTRFRATVDHEKVRRHLKNNFTFSEYLSIFDKNETTPEQPLTQKDRFEIDCVVEEAKILRDYVLSVKEKADELGRDLIIIPNLSYGYLPVSPIFDELNQKGINSIIGVKVGSTQSHNNKEVINSRLFKGHRTEIANTQPLIIVVDGTTHLVARDDSDREARYPDAYQGYLNQVIAINDAQGFTEVDYSNVGKTSEDMVKLRQTEEFQRSVKVYNDVLKNEDSQKEKQPYLFGLWNTAGLKLIIRNYHQKIDYVTETTPEKIESPAMIFCNVGLLDNQISSELKEKYKGLVHEPAFFDDKSRIINFDFGFDNFGVRYLNRLETEVKKSFGSIQNKSFNEDFVSSLIKYVQKNPFASVEYEAS